MKELKTKFAFVYRSLVFFNMYKLNSVIGRARKIRRTLVKAV